jgi:hypothetical protein
MLQTFFPVQHKLLSGPRKVAGLAGDGVHGIFRALRVGPSVGLFDLDAQGLVARLLDDLGLLLGGACDARPRPAGRRGFGWGQGRGEAARSGRSWLGS